MRLQTILEVRAVTHEAGLTFGAADTDLLPLSDGNACCSGADLHLPDGGQPFGHTYLSAVRQSSTGVVSYGAIESEWAPTRSIARFVNSNSRIKGSAGASIRDCVHRNWIGRANGPSPDMFYGVDPTGDVDDHGLVRYSMAPWLVDEITGNRACG